MKKICQQRHFGIGVILAYRLWIIPVLCFCAIIVFSSFDLTLKAMEEDQSIVCNLSSVLSAIALATAEALAKDDWSSLPTEVKLHIMSYLLSKGDKFKEFFGYSLVSRDFASLVNDCPLSAVKTYTFPDQKKITLNDIFFKAVKRGHYKVVEMFIERDIADIEAQDSDGDTALIWAAFYGQTKIVNLLIDCGANIEAHNNGDHTALIKAALCGDAEIVKLLIENRADIGASSDCGHTALMLAALICHREIVKLLIERGADTQAQDCCGKTALIRAADGGHTDIVKLLIERDANIETQDILGNTALTLAARNGHTEIVELLQTASQKN